MDTSIRKKTTAERAAWQQQTTDSRHEAIKAMAKALEDMDYKRGDAASMVNTADAEAATSAMLRRLIELGDIGFILEFVTEASDAVLSAIFRNLCDHMDTHEQDAGTRLVSLLSTQCRWYGEKHLEEALNSDALPSASEIERDRRVDQDIKQAKETA